jgi:hypothetical protein
MKKHRLSDRRACSGCNQRRSISTYRGHACWRPQHDLCPRCWRAALDALRAARLAATTDAPRAKAA